MKFLTCTKHDSTYTQGNLCQHQFMAACIVVAIMHSEHASKGSDEQCKQAERSFVLGEYISYQGVYQKRQEASTLQVELLM